MVEVEFGTYNPDGSVKEWPRTDINGAGYSRPCTTVRVSADKFIVVPANPPLTLWERVEAIKAKHAAPAPQQFRRVTSEKPDAE